MNAPRNGRCENDFAHKILLFLLLISFGQSPDEISSKKTAELFDSPLSAAVWFYPDFHRLLFAQKEIRPSEFGVGIGIEKNKTLAGEKDRTST
jgi:hypothetical protein